MKAAPKRKPMLNAHVGVAGLFKMGITRPDGTRRTVAPWQNNLITDTGMDNFGNSGATTSLPPQYSGYCRVGTGAVPVPAVGDAALVAHVAEAGALQFEERGVGGDGSAGDPYYKFSRRTYRFGIGIAEGILAEVGAGMALGTGDLTTRSLIKDGNGDPITVTVLFDEILDVTYEFRFYQPVLTDVTGTIVIDSQTFDWVIRPAVVGYLSVAGSTGPLGRCVGFYVYSGDLGLVTGSPTLQDEGVGSFPTYLPYVNGNHYNENTLFFDINAHENIGPEGIRALRWDTPSGNWQISLINQGTGKGVLHNNTTNFTFKGRITWDRYTPP